MKVVKRFRDKYTKHIYEVGDTYPHPRFGEERTQELLKAGAIQAEIDVSDMKVAELKEALDQKGIEYPSDAKKDELIALLTE